MSPPSSPTRQTKRGLFKRASRIYSEKEANGSSLSLARRVKSSLHLNSNINGSLLALLFCDQQSNGQQPRTYLLARNLDKIWAHSRCLVPSVLCSTKIGNQLLCSCKQHSTVRIPPVHMTTQEAYQYQYRCGRIRRRIKQTLRRNHTTHVSWTRLSTHPRSPDTRRASETIWFRTLHFA